MVWTRDGELHVPEDDPGQALRDPGVNLSSEAAHGERPLRCSRQVRGQLRDALGREVMQQRVAGYQNTVPLQGLGAGVYVLELQDRGRRVAVQRVVVSVL